MDNNDDVDDDDVDNDDIDNNNNDVDNDDIDNDDSISTVDDDDDNAGENLTISLQFTAAPPPQEGKILILNFKPQT